MDIAHIRGASIGGGNVATARTVAELHASTEREEPLVMVPDPLLRAMNRVGINSPDDGNRLSQQQFERLLEGKSIEERIGLKRFAQAAGVYPRSSAPYGQ